jgi:nitrogen fixation protein FixH
MNPILSTSPELTPSHPRAGAAWNPWPYALIGYFAVFITAVVLFTAWSLHQKTDLVGTDYYDQEIRYQDQIDRLRRTAAVGPAVQIGYGSGRIKINLPTEHLSKGVSGVVHFYRPSNAALDHEVPLAVDTFGHQTIGAAGLIPGLWRVRVGWKAGGEEFFRDETIVVPHATP